MVMSSAKLLMRFSLPLLASAAPLAVAVGEGEFHQVLVAIGHVADADLVLPVDAAHDSGLWRIVVLFPVIAAAVEVVKHGGRNGEVPAAAEDVGIAPANRCSSRKSPAGPAGPSAPGFWLGAVIAPVAGDAASRREIVVALDADLGVGRISVPFVIEVVVRHVAERAGSRAIVRAAASVRPRKRPAPSPTVGSNRFFGIVLPGTRCGSLCRPRRRSAVVGS